MKEKKPFNPVECKCKKESIGLVLSFKNHPSGQNDVELRCPLCDKGTAYEGIIDNAMKVEFDGGNTIQIIRTGEFESTRLLPPREPVKLAKAKKK